MNAKNIFEFGTTIYLAKAAKENGGKVISTEYLPHKVKIAKENIRAAGLSDYVEIIERDVLDTMKNNASRFDMALPDGWPNLVFPVFKLTEQHLNAGALIIVNDVEGFGAAMQNYLEYVRNPTNGYLSTMLKPAKGLEFTVKLQ